ncbi:hypothetical protein [Pedobacter psychrodurus]|uniref:hypothetical protein n=1 Tax=Pedobacter psychrodurus TaxID=2530456 RepID=UPI00292CF8EC|nr:hypothetical protein [Pedobacter psychrodurus]
MEALNNIERIKQEINQYYEMSFENEIEDYLFNKKLKEKLQKVIIDYNTDEIIIQKALLILAESTGCDEDQEIADEILDLLYDKKYIKQKDLDFFYQNVATRRWF